MLSTVEDMWSEELEGRLSEDMENAIGWLRKPRLVPWSGDKVFRSFCVVS